MIKILHITEDNSTRNYGVTAVVNDLNQHLKNKNINSKIISPIINEDDKETLYVKPTFSKPIWRHSLELKDYLKKNSLNHILHIHGIWMYPQYITSKIAYNTNTTYILTPHGMLEPWLWNKGSFQKKIYFNLMIKKNFLHANILHAITPNEKENLYKLFKHKNIEIIPNSISYRDITKLNIIRKNQKKYILFLGRLDPKKGIDLLIKAFSKIKNNNVTLKIAGPINEYKKLLDLLVINLIHFPIIIFLVSLLNKYFMLPIQSVPSINRLFIFMLIIVIIYIISIIFAKFTEDKTKIIQKRLLDEN